MPSKLIQPWPKILEWYAYLASNQQLSQSGSSRIHMYHLVQEIMDRGYADHFYAWTSMDELKIVQLPVLYPFDGPYLKISPQQPDILEFCYIDSVFRKPDWRRRVAGSDGLRRFENFLIQLHWLEQIPVKTN